MIDASNNIVSTRYFIEAIRDAGYRDISSALAELIDNAIEADSQEIEITFDLADNGARSVTIADDGTGMTSSTLEAALRFGGSSRFNSRNGLGRFGMGLPSSSVSHARRVDITTWRNPGSGWTSYLDVDEIAAGKKNAIARPRRINLQSGATGSGTVVVWSKCDRIVFDDEGRFLENIGRTLGRVFRKHLWAGKRIFLNRKETRPVDPLYLSGSRQSAVPYGPPLEYDVLIPGSADRTSTISVQFASLPIERWHDLSNSEKRAMGISKGAGVSIVRSDREIDYGWFFMGKKRRENYDDWWRCEICFRPELDELFGVTNTKQGIRPTEYIRNILSPDIERIAHELNRQVRSRYMTVKSRNQPSPSAKTAARRDHRLEPPQRQNVEPKFFSYETSRVAAQDTNAVIPGLKYRFESQRMSDKCFFMPLFTGEEIILVLNENHPFYQCMCEPSMRLFTGSPQMFPQLIELMLLAAGRAECAITPFDRAGIIGKMREEWGGVLATFLE